MSTIVRSGEEKVECEWALSAFIPPDCGSDGEDGDEDEEQDGNEDKEEIDSIGNTEEDGEDFDVNEDADDEIAGEGEWAAATYRPLFIADQDHDKGPRIHGHHNPISDDSQADTNWNSGEGGVSGIALTMSPIQVNTSADVEAEEREYI